MGAIFLPVTDLLIYEKISGLLVARNSRINKEKERQGVAPWGAPLSARMWALVAALIFSVSVTGCNVLEYWFQLTQEKPWVFDLAIGIFVVTCIGLLVIFARYAYLLHIFGKEERGSDKKQEASEKGGSAQRNERDASSSLAGPPAVNKQIAIPLTEDEAGSLADAVIDGLNRSQFKILKINNDGYEDEYIYGDNSYFRDEGYIIEPSGKRRIVFIRIGYLFILDAAVYSQLSEELKTALGSNVILLNELSDKAIGHHILSYFNTPVILDMMHKDIVDRFVVDAGAGEGILSLAAYKLGASFVYLYEKYEHLLSIAKEQLKLNNIVEGIDFQLYRGDIQDRSFVRESAGMISNTMRDAPKEMIMVSNIGVWDGYRVTNADSINLIKYLPEVSLFIAGGYIRDSTQYEQVKRDQELIRQIGFKINPEAVMIDSTGMFGSWSAVNPAFLSGSMINDPINKGKFLLK